jgi:hypothetical protein
VLQVKTCVFHFDGKAVLGRTTYEYFKSSTGVAAASRSLQAFMDARVDLYHLGRRLRLKKLPLEGDVRLGVRETDEQPILGRDGLVDHTPAAIVPLGDDGTKLLTQAARGMGT